MKPTSFDAIAAATGLLCGSLSNYGILRGSWWNLAFWGIVGVVIGFFASDNKEALRAGIWYGMVLVLSFLFSGFKGSADKFLGFSLFALVGAIIGGACGLALGLTGNRIRRIPR
jgi:hypothetical protein